MHLYITPFFYYMMSLTYGSQPALQKEMFIIGLILQMEETEG